ncbi:MAG: DegT/DnrJ/EryC1/StrS aminotransferase family protein [Oscillospiraceae bacterium]
MDRKIPFSPPDITDLEINEVIDALKSGWITTGPKTKEFERQIANYCNTKKAVCLNSATACMEMALRILGIGEGDEVITSAYTYTASASVIDHVGAKIVLVDTKKDSFFMDYDKLAEKITDKTKAIIPVDIGGKLCDYDRIFDIIESKKDIFKPNSDMQKAIGRICVVADAAHSFGGKYKGKTSGEIADFTSFSFHAVKNLTTAEGGGLCWREIDGVDSEKIYKDLMLLSLHGQSKDALAKTQLGAWEYDIISTAYKCNMTDIAAAIGLVQLQRYDKILKRRKQIIQMYNDGIKREGVSVLEHFEGDYESSGHLYLVNFSGKKREYRDNFITEMAKRGVATNVHYKPLPMHTAYKNLGFDIKDFPNAYGKFENEITLPLNTKLTDEHVKYVIDMFNEVISL